MDIASFERDLERLSKITNKKLTYIKLLGGEPLLNPDCHEIMRISRKYFDEATNIILLTNGVLLTKQNEQFWQSARDNKVWIAITHYPVKLNLEEIKKTAIKYGVPCGYFILSAGIIDFSQDTSRGQKMYKFPLDITGSQNMEASFAHCPKSNSCFTLRDGKLLTCSTLPHIMHFSEYFGKELTVTEKDYIDIYKVDNVEEILDFLAKPIPFCRYCNTKEISLGHEWAVSRKDISEWT